MYQQKNNYESNRLILELLPNWKETSFTETRRETFYNPRILNAGVITHVEKSQWHVCLEI